MSDEYEDLRQALREGKEVEWERDVGDWQPIALDDRSPARKWWLPREMYRIKPTEPQIMNNTPKKTKLIPWTKETCPVGTWVKNKGSDATAWRIVAVGAISAALGVTQDSIPYQALMRDFTTIDGKPCGTEVEVPEEPIKVGDVVEVITHHRSMRRGKVISIGMTTNRTYYTVDIQRFDGGEEYVGVFTETEIGRIL